MERIKNIVKMCEKCSQEEECTEHLKHRKQILYDKSMDNCYLFETYKDVVEFNKEMGGDKDGLQDSSKSIIKLPVKRKKSKRLHR
jgi:hypothetical protein